MNTTPSSSPPRFLLFSSSGRSKPQTWASSPPPLCNGFHALSIFKMLTKENYLLTRSREAIFTERNLLFGQFLVESSPDGRLKCCPRFRWEITRRTEIHSGLVGTMIDFWHTHTHTHWKQRTSTSATTSANDIIASVANLQNQWEEPWRSII